MVHWSKSLSNVFPFYQKKVLKILFPSYFWHIYVGTRCKNMLGVTPACSAAFHIFKICMKYSVWILNKLWKNLNGVTSWKAVSEYSRACIWAMHDELYVAIVETLLCTIFRTFQDQIYMQWRKQKLFLGKLLNC